MDRTVDEKAPWFVRAIPQELRIELEENVIRGGEWLDKKSPGWENLVDLDDFDLTNGTMCICGHVFKEMGNKECISGYSYATELFPTYENTDQFSYDHGFVGTPRISNNGSWRYCELIWTEQILKRRADKGTILGEMLDHETN